MLGLLGNVLYACHTCNAYIVCVSAWKDVAITSYIIFMYCTFSYYHESCLHVACCKDRVFECMCNIQIIRLLIDTQ